MALSIDVRAVAVMLVGSLMATFLAVVCSQLDFLLKGQTAMHTRQPLVGVLTQPLWQAAAFICQPL